MPAVRLSHQEKKEVSLHIRACADSFFDYFFLKLAIRGRILIFGMIWKQGYGVVIVGEGEELQKKKEFYLHAFLMVIQSGIIFIKGK